MTFLLRYATLLLLVGGVQQIEGAKVLMIFAAPSRSHYILGEPLGVALAERGHEVTMVSPFKLGRKVENFNEIVLDVEMDILKMLNTKSDSGLKTISHWQMVFQMGGFAKAMSIPVLENPAIKELIKSNAKFDAAIITVHLNECLHGLIKQFDAIPIAFSTIESSQFSNRMTGNPFNPSYDSSPFMASSISMSFLQRMSNVGIVVMENLLNRFHMSSQRQIYEDYFKPLYEDGELPDIEDLIRNVSLVLLNSHYVVSNVAAKLPIIVDVAGIHIKANPLPQDIQDFIDTAKDGVIYFSMGSNLKSADLIVEKRDAILKVFKSLKQKVLWKWEDANLPNKPDNVFIKPWMPQQSILAHPNVKLFITHGGLLSSIESLYFGKPMVGIPIFGDQHMNMAKAVSSGYGITLKLEDLSEKSLAEVLRKVLFEPSYNETATRLSKIFRDEPLSGLEKAIFNIEYVLRHKGARFLRSPSIDMPMYQILLIDVIGTFLLTFGLVIFIFYYVTKKIYTKVCSDSKITNQFKKHN